MILVIILRNAPFLREFKKKFWQNPRKVTSEIQL